MSRDSREVSWGSEGGCLDIEMIDGEQIENVWNDGTSIYVKSTLNRVWKSTDTTNNKMQHFDMVELPIS